jgi:hypothetical protein
MLFMIIYYIKKNISEKKRVSTLLSTQVIFHSLIKIVRNT